MPKKLLSAFLAVLLTASLLAACADNSAVKSAETTEASVTAEGETTAVDYLAPLGAHDFDGADYVMLCRSEKEYEMFSEQENGEPVNDAVFKRNSAVSDRYDTVISVHAIPGTTANKDSFIKEVSRSVLAADCAYDSIAGHLTFFATVAIDGYLMNLYSLPELDFDAEWWAKGFTDNNTVGGKLYVATGNLAFSMYESLYVIFFNKQLAEDYNMPDFYSIVKSGDWTFDEMSGYINQVSADVNGDSKFTAADCYGMIINHHCARVFQTCFDMPITKRNDDGYYDLVYANDKLYSAYDKVYALLYDSGHSVFLSKPSADTDYTEMLNIFADNRALFFTGTLEYTSTMRQMDSDFGILPFPKYDAAQENYITHAYGGTSIFSVPLVVKDNELSGVILEALCAESTATTIPAFYDIVLQTKFIRDEQSGEMISLIAKSVYFDFGYLNSQYMDSIFQLFGDSLWNKTKSIASAYASKQKAFEKKFAEIMEKYAELES